MFLGTYETKFTGTGRVILPKKLRLKVGSQVILCKGFETCILGFSKEDFEKATKSTLEISNTEEQGRYLRRYLFSGSEPVELDAQGRFVIPSTLLDFARVKNLPAGRQGVLIIGAGDHFEIWDKTLWAKHMIKLGKRYGQIS